MFKSIGKSSLFRKQTTVPESIAFAVEYWANQIKTPESLELPQLDKSISESYQKTVRQPASDSISKAMLDKFKEQLTKLLVGDNDANIAIWKKVPNGMKQCYLEVNCDYDPQERLAEAAKFADIPFAVFPIKTYMEIHQNKVVVSTLKDKVIVWEKE